MSPLQKKIFYIALPIKLLLCLMVPLVLDEYYYWFWGQNLQWSYFDHPPMVGWIMALGDAFKDIAPGAIRWPFAIISHATIWLWIKMTNGLLQENTGTCFLLVLLLNPLTGWGGIVATPDIPLLFFWSLALFWAHKIVERGSLTDYFLFGAFLGLGFLSKYIMVIFLLCLPLWIWREGLVKKLLQPSVLVTLFAGLLFCAPVLIWNLQNDWASFDFQWKHGTVAIKRDWRWPLDYIGGQLLILFPVFWVFLIRQKQKVIWLLSFALVPLVFFLVTSFFNRVEANWPIVAYPAFYALSLVGLSQTGKAWLKPVLGFWLICLIAVSTMPFWLAKGSDLRGRLKLFEAEKYDELTLVTQELKPFYARSYQMASYLNFYGDRFFCKLPKVGRPDFFSFIEKCQSPPDQFFFANDKISGPIRINRLYPDLKVVGPVASTPHFELVEVARQ